MMKFRSHIGQIRGLGSARDGTHHWWMQRMTGLALVPLTFWFVWVLIGLVGAEYQVVVDRFNSPIFSALVIIVLVSLCYHAVLGLQVVIEDYVHLEVLKIAMLVVMKWSAFLLCIISVLSVVRVALVG